MTDTVSKTPRSVATDQLAEFGLSTYAARTYVALVSLGGGTAQDVSEVADVPRTRVYDAVDELESHGLVDVQQSSPKQFWPVSAETTGSHFERYYRDRVGRLTAALDDLEPSSRADEQRGVWTVEGRTTVTERIVEFVEAAEREVVFMTVQELLTEVVVNALAAASDRGVSIKLASMGGPVEDNIHERVPDAEVFESIWAWSDTPAGRLVMIDQSRTLVSVLADSLSGQDEAPSATERDETAIWGSGSTNGLVVVLQAMFTWQLDGGRD